MRILQADVRIWTIVFCLMIASLFSAIPRAFGASYDGKIKECESAISKEQSNLKAIEVEIGIQRSKVRKIEQKERGVRQRLGQIEKNLRARKRELEIYRWNLGQAQKKRACLLDDLAESSALREGKCRSLNGILRNVYKAKLLSDLTPMSTPADIEKHKLLTLVARQNIRVFEGARQRENLLRAALEDLDRYQRKVSLYQGVASKKKEGIAKERKDKKRLLTKVYSQRQAHQQRIEQLQADARKLRALIESLQAEKSETEEEARLAGMAFQKKRGLLPWPTQSRRIAKYFGKERHPQFKTYIFNNGIDIECLQASEVVSVSSGKVVFAKWSSNPGLRSYGKLVIVDHGGGYYTLYSHLSAILVKLGQKVSAGQTIGRIGDTASPNDPLLHFEIRRGGQPLDPLEWLRK